MLRKTPAKPFLTFLVFALIGVAFFFLWSRQFTFDPQTGKDLEYETIPETGAIYSMEPIVVELAGRYIMVTKNEKGDQPTIGTRKKQLVFAVDLEVETENMREELKKQLHQIRDAIVGIVADKNAKKMETVEGKAVLRAEIVIKLNHILKKAVVSKVFFREFMIL